MRSVTQGWRFDAALHDVLGDARQVDAGLTSNEHNVVFRYFSMRRCSTANCRKLARRRVIVIGK